MTSTRQMSTAQLRQTVARYSVTQLRREVRTMRAIRRDNPNAVFPARFIAVCRAAILQRTGESRAVYSAFHPMHGWMGEREMRA